MLDKGFRFRFGQCVEGFPVPRDGDHTATVVWLHGLGDSGYGWAPVSDQLVGVGVGVGVSVSVSVSV